MLQVARRYGSFPVILETYRECLQDVFDLPSLKKLLQGLRTRELDLVDVETRRPVVVVDLNVPAAGHAEHLLRLLLPIADHPLGVVVVTNRSDQQRNSPLIFLRRVQGDGVGLPRNGLTLHVHVDPPRARLC